MSTRTHFARKDLPPARPHLAPNVVCMFQEDRPPVQQSGRRGRYPRKVAKLSDRPRLMPGDIAEITIDPWRGVRVMILERGSDPRHNGALHFKVVVLGEPVEISGENCDVANVQAHVLRLVKCGYMSEWRRVEAEIGRLDASHVRRSDEDRITRLMEIAVRSMVQNLRIPVGSPE